MRVGPFAHRSLLIRLLAASVLIAVCSVAATAWLAARTTAQAVRKEQGQVLADDTVIYTTLVGYAATHPTWDDVQPVVRALARRTGRTITLTARGRTRALARTGPVAALPDRASAVVDPLHVDASVVTGGAAGGIDPRALGPYRLTEAERRVLDPYAGKVLSCLRSVGYTGRIARWANGHPYVVVGATDYDVRIKASQICHTAGLERPTADETKALTRLRTLAADCLRRHDLKQDAIGLDFTVPNGSATAQTCVDSARREQLTPYVAPAAQLYVGSPSQGTGTAVFDLSPANTVRIAGVAGLVLLVTVSVTVLAGIRLVRPLRALTEAALRPAGSSPVRVPVTGNDEIGRLAAAFNDLSERRERLEEQRKAMTSDIAHELRTPLGNIRSWLEAAEDGIAVPDTAFTSSLLEEALQLQHIIDDLQDLAAADAGTLALHPEPLYVRDLLEHAAAAYGARAAAAGVTVASGTDGDPVLTADPVRLRQIVGNLVSNAVRHTPHGGSVTLSARREADRVLIEVADTGAGIPPEDLPRVFDRFWRADKSRRRLTGSSGLGLAIVRRLVEAHGGTVAVRSTPGEGTVFSLRLPV
ncbi:two-component system sensor histidine kinase BaeS [Streptomyces sp. Ag109_O5-1]|nr:two-component system sensor histidine kinase BaeS [Streptomyces sp. Ag109_O5-1]